MIGMTMNACVHFSTLILCNVFYKHFYRCVKLDSLHFKIFLIAMNLQNDSLIPHSQIAFLVDE